MLNLMIPYKSPGMSFLLPRSFWHSFIISTVVWVSHTTIALHQHLPLEGLQVAPLPATDSCCKGTFPRKG